MKKQQPPGLLTELDHNDSDEAMDQLGCVFPKAILQCLDQGLHIQTMEAEIMQDATLCNLYQPPLVLEYCLQPLTQPGLHRIQEVLSLLEQFCPHLRQEATNKL